MPSMAVAFIASALMFAARELSGNKLRELSGNKLQVCALPLEREDVMADPSCFRRPRTFSPVSVSAFPHSCAATTPANCSGDKRAKALAIELASTSSDRVLGLGCSCAGNAALHCYSPLIHKEALVPSWMTATWFHCLSTSASGVNITTGALDDAVDPTLPVDESDPGPSLV